MPLFEWLSKEIYEKYGDEGLHKIEAMLDDLEGMDLEPGQELRTQIASIKLESGGTATFFIMAEVEDEIEGGE